MSTKLDRHFHWNVFDLCYNPPATSFGIIILNTALRDIEDNTHIIRLWRKASVRVCVDGGTNEFYSYIHQEHEKNGELKMVVNGEQINKSEEKQSFQNGNGPQLCPEIPLPDIISGDFDSIKPDILQFYSDLGVTIVETPAQDQTDFTKALLVTGDHIIKTGLKISHMLVIAGINADRFDHVLSHLNTLYRMNGILPSPVIIMSGHSLLWLLDSGSHSIRVPWSLVENKELSWCGYAAFSEPVLVTTSGLKWDVCKRTVAFGQLISTSNTYAPSSKGEVSVDCSRPLLWFMGWGPT